MKNLLFAITAVLAVTAWGCGAADEGTSSSTTTAAVDHSDHVHYCAACGEEAGNDNCCSDEAEKCESCDLNKGSALCCKGVEVKEGKICGACGESEGNEKCCSADAEKCDGCGLNKGSALCCKMDSKEEKEEATDE